MKKQVVLMLTAILLLFGAGQAAWAFSDTANDPNAAKIEALQKAGVLSGDKSGKFHPGGQLTYAQGISLIVRALELNIDHIRFVKEPLATDSFPNLKNDAWYSQAFVIAAHNGLEVPKDVRADQPMTKEQFAFHLYNGVQQTGEYADIEIYIVLKDEADVSKGYMEAIQKLLIRKIAALDENGMFHPKKLITRSEAVAWVHDALAFVRDMKGAEPAGEPDAFPLTDLALTTTPVNDKVTEVTVTAKAPHPGYGLRIVSVVFEGTNANVYVEAVLPNPDMNYAQVITDVQAVTYIGAEYKPVLFAGGQSVSGSTGAADAPLIEQKA